MPVANAAATAFLIVVALAFFQNVVAGTWRDWLAAKFLNRGAPAPLAATTTSPFSSGPLAYGPGITGTTPGGAYTLPVPGGRLISVWGDPRDGGARTHRGIDLAAPKGSPAVAVFDGTAVRVGSGGALCGKRVAIRAADGTEALYCHLDGFAIAQGQTVRQGQTIGFVGNSGNAANTPAHVHFELRRNGSPFNPAPVFGL